MRRLIYSVMISLDGFMSRPNGDLDWVIVDRELHTYINHQQDQIGAYLYGRRMYQLMVDSWPTADADASAPDFIAEFARIWRRMPKVVFSTTLEHVGWNAILVRGEAGAEIAKLKGQPGKDLNISGADLAATAMRRGLIDEYQFFVNPIMLGSGIRPFPSLEPAIHLKLLETRAFGSGVVFLRYGAAEEGQHV